MSRDAASAMPSPKFTSDGGAKDRFTVHYEIGRTPTLLMQLSPFDPSPPSIIEESIKSRSSYIRSSVNLHSPVSTRFSASLYDDSSTKPRHVAPTKNFRETTNVPSPLSLHPPNLPPPAKLQDRYPSPSTENEASLPFGVVPPKPFSSPTNDEPQSVKLAGNANSSMITSRPFLTPTGQQTSARSTPEITESPSRLQINTRHLSDAMSSRSSYSVASWNRESTQWQPQDVENRFPQFLPKNDPREPGRAEYVGKQGDFGTTTISQQLGEEKASRERARKRKGMALTADLVRIKSIGRAPRKYTPQPTPTDSTRTSVAVEQILPSQTNVVMDEAAHGEPGKHSEGSVAF
jgi:hypothetical protein